MKKGIVKACSKKEKNQVATTFTDDKQGDVAGCSRENAELLYTAEKSPVATQKDNISCSNVDVNVNNTISTSFLLATRRYMKSWGIWDKSEEILLEQIDKEHYIYNHEGEIGIAKVEDINQVSDKGKIFSIRGIQLDNEAIYLPPNNQQAAKNFYNTPYLDKCEKFVDGEYKPREFPEIYADIKKTLKELFDFADDLDIEISALAIAQSWIKPYLNTFFFYGVDATKGGGKTTLGEIVYFLMRHGFMGGNISTAALVRLIDDLDLNIFVDEIDQNQKDEDMMAILRKGQRRGNPYVRCEGRDNHPVVYNIAGCHGFSFRSEIEDAFMDRSLRVHTSKSMDSRLPVINTFKQDILKDLADELFLWYVMHFHEIGTKQNSVFNQHNISRESYFSALTSNLTEEERKYLSELFGRDSEISFLCMDVAHKLNIDLLKSIQGIIAKKKIDTAASDNFYNDSLVEYLHKNFKSFCTKQKKDGLYVGYYYYPKNKLFQGFVQYLKSLNVASIGTKKYSSILREFGFIEGDNQSSQRYDNYPTPCLIFNPKVLDNLSLPYPAALELKGVVEDFEK